MAVADVVLMCIPPGCTSTMSTFTSTNISDFVKSRTIFNFKIGDKTSANTDANEPRNDAEAIAHSLVYGAINVKKREGAWAFEISNDKIVYTSAATMRAWFQKGCDGDVAKYAHYLIVNGWYALSPTLGPHANGPSHWVDSKAKDKEPRTPKTAGGSAKSMMPAIDVDEENPRKKARTENEEGGEISSDEIL